jgi:predicted deacetylase
LNTGKKPPQILQMDADKTFNSKICDCLRHLRMKSKFNPTESFETSQSNSKERIAMQQPKTSQYLLRFDDLCPTMNWTVWSDIEAVLVEHRVKPILAVVPDNQDPLLRVNAPVDDFWGRVRQWQARGWTIAMHGYQHKYSHRSVGIITGLKKSEFAGVPAAQQEEKLRKALEIFKQQGIKTRVWIAPSNSFDYTTANLLPRFGINVICDGCFRYPFVDKRNLTWVPQQLHGFRPAPPGVWTVCCHHNYWGAADLGKFREALQQFRPNIAPLDDILRIWAGHTSWWSAWLCTTPRISHRLIRMELKLWEWRMSRGSKSNRPPTSKTTLQPTEQNTVAHPAAERGTVVSKIQATL